MIQDSLQEKQKYLSQQILDKGYDPEQFQNFLLNNSDKQLDLESWGLKQLKIMVAKFKKQSFIGSQDSGQNQQNEKKEIQKNDAKQMNINLQQTISVSPSFNSSVYRHYNYVKKTFIPMLYDEVHNKKKCPQITIRKYTKTSSNNIFKSSYILYQIRMSNKWIVNRRYSDFLWLYKSLQKSYSGFPIPPIPQKNLIRSFDEKHLQTRMMVFQKFLTTLLFIPQICSDPILQDFLRIQNQKEFNKYKKQNEEKINKKINKYQIHSILGEDNMIIQQSSIGEQKLSFYQNINKKYDKLNNNLWILLQNLKKVSYNCFQISKTVQQINKQMKNKKNSDIFGVLNQFFISLGQHFQKINQFVKNKITSVWQYQKMYSKNIVQIIQNVKKQQQTLNNKQKSMIKVADQLDQSFTNSLQPNKQLKEYQIVKQKYKTRLSYVIKEIKRYEDQQLSNISKEWKISLRQFSQKISNLVIGVADQLVKTISLCEGKKLVQVQYINN